MCRGATPGSDSLINAKTLRAHSSAAVPTTKRINVDSCHETYTHRLAKPHKNAETRSGKAEITI